MPCFSFSYKTQNKEATVLTVLAVSAVVAVSVMTATPPYELNPFSVILRGLLNRKRSRMGLKQQEADLTIFGRRFFTTTGADVSGIKQSAKPGDARGQARYDAEMPPFISSIHFLCPARRHPGRPIILGTEKCQRIPPNH